MYMNRYETENEPRRVRERPRDEFGRFESEPYRNRDDRRNYEDDMYGRGEHSSRGDYFGAENDGGRRFEGRFDMQRDDRGLERANREENRSRNYNDWGSQSASGRSNDYSLTNDRAHDRGFIDRGSNDRGYSSGSDWGGQNRSQNWGGQNRGGQNWANEHWSNSGRRPESEYLGYTDERANAGFSDHRSGSQFGDNRSSRGVNGGSYGRNDQTSRGQHAGKGPKGYRRSDERIEEDVNEALSQHSEIDATEIQVKVSNGEVTLTGTVHDRQAKRLAEDIAERCSGVQDVRNDIRVQREHESGDSNAHQQNKTKPATGTGNKNAEAKSA